MVAGGLALLKQLFRDQLFNTALVERLLETADNSGIYADRAIYGRGKMDLGAATSPVGILSVPVFQATGRACPSAIDPVSVRGGVRRRPHPVASEPGDHGAG